MPIYIGNNEIDSLHIGSNDVENVYIGDEEVWSNWDGLLMQNNTFKDNPYNITAATGDHIIDTFALNSWKYHGAEIKTNGKVINFGKFTSITFTYACGNQTGFRIVDENGNELQSLYTLINGNRAVNDSGTITVNLANVTGRLSLYNNTGSAQRDSSSAGITYIKLNK